MDEYEYDSNKTIHRIYNQIANVLSALKMYHKSGDPNYLLDYNKMFNLGNSRPLALFTNEPPEVVDLLKINYLQLQFNKTDIRLYHFNFLRKLGRHYLKNAIDIMLRPELRPFVLYEIDSQIEADIHNNTNVTAITISHNISDQKDYLERFVEKYRQYDRHKRLALDREKLMNEFNVFLHTDNRYFRYKLTLINPQPGSRIVNSEHIYTVFSTEGMVATNYTVNKYPDAPFSIDINPPGNIDFKLFSLQDRVLFTDSLLPRVIDMAGSLKRFAGREGTSYYFPTLVFKQAPPVQFTPTTDQVNLVKSLVYQLLSMELTRAYLYDELGGQTVRFISANRSIEQYQYATFIANIVLNYLGGRTMVQIVKDPNYGLLLVDEEQREINALPLLVKSFNDAIDVIEVLD
jgi:hypothetical protein